MVRELAYTGRRLPAARAKELGLVNETYRDHAALLAGVMQVAAEIAERSPLAVCGSKEMLNYARDHSVADSLNYMAAWQTGMFQPADILECFRGEERKAHNACSRISRSSRNRSSSSRPDGGHTASSSALRWWRDAASHPSR